MSTNSSSDRDPVERLAEDYLERRRRGEQPSVSEYAHRFPQLAERINVMFPALALMEQLKPDSDDQTASAANQEQRAAHMPDRLGEYRIIREIGHGGMGVVYEAIQESLGRHVALKILPWHGRIDPVQIERFQVEARSAARLHHTHIVPVYGVGEHQGVHYYAMQYIQGHGLDAILADLRRLRGGATPSATGESHKADTGSVAVARSLLTGRFASSRAGRQSEPPSPTNTDGKDRSRDSSAGDQASASGSTSSVLSHPTESGYHRAVARLAIQVAGALAHAHQQGVLHRDIKPSNLLLDVDGHVWVTDFGLAKVEGADGPTKTDDIVGTLRYMAPERFDGWSDRRSDIYGLGVTLYELVTLRPAFAAAAQAKLIEQVIHDPPVAPRKVDPRIPRDLETIILKSIAKEPGQRYATVEALATDLTNYLADRPIVARRSRLPERAWRWCRRNPAAAGLLAASAVVALALVGIGVALVDHGRVERAYQREVAARKSEAEARYFGNMVLAEREWSGSNVGRAEQLLNMCVPERGSADLRGWEWHYLKRQSHTELMTIPVPPTQGVGIAVSPDDRHIATSDHDDRQVRMWNAQTGELEKTLPGLYSNNSEGLAFSPDGKLLVASSGGFFTPGGVIVWDSATGTQLWEFSDVCGMSASVAFSPDNKFLAVVSGEMDKEKYPPAFTMCDMKTLSKCYTITGEKGEMGWISVAFSPDGHSFATASGKLEQDSTDNQPGVVTIRDSRTGNPIGRPLRHPGPLTCVAYSPDRTRPMVATTGWDMMLRLWDVETGQEIKSVRAGPQVSFKVVFSADGSRIATACDDNSVRIWDAARFQDEPVTLRGHTREVHSLAFNSDGTRLATLSMDATVKIWDPATDKKALTLPGRPGEWVDAVSFSAPDGRRVASGRTDGVLKLHDAVTGQKLNEYPRLGARIFCVAYSPDNRVLATGSGDWTKPKIRGRITLRDAANGGLINTLEAHAGMVLSVAFSPDGSRLATAGGEHNYEKGIVKIWDTTTWQEIASYGGHDSGRLHAAYSPDGRFLASAGFDSRVLVRDAQTGQLIRELSGHGNYNLGIAFSPKGDRLVSAELNEPVAVWDVATGEEVGRFRGHKSIVWCVAFSPDGTRAASGGDDGTVKIWDPVTGQEALTLRGHTDPVLCVAFSPDGTRIASSSKDGTVKIWDGTPWVEPP